MPSTVQRDRWAGLRRGMVYSYGNGEIMTANWFRVPVLWTRVRAYFAPVNRATQTPVQFDRRRRAAFRSIPHPLRGSSRVDPKFHTKINQQDRTAADRSPGSNTRPGTRDARGQVSFEFLSWTKLTMALATGSQHMNLLVGGAVEVQQGSTASIVQLGAGDANNFPAGSMIAVDADYSGQTGFIGEPISGHTSASHCRPGLHSARHLRCGPGCQHELSLAHARRTIVWRRACIQRED